MADSGSNGTGVLPQWPSGTRYLTQITESDHAGWLWIITLMSFVYVMSAFIIRFVVKYGMYGHDDWALLASTVAAVGQYIAVLGALSRGLGRSFTLLSADQISTIEKYTAVHTALYILAHSLSKISTALLTQRLFENGRRRSFMVLSWVLVFISALYGLVGILAAFISCRNPSYPHLGSDSCHNQLARWQIILSLDMASEILLVVVPLALVLNILIERSAKITVTAIFAFRLMDVVFAALNFHQISVLSNSNNYGTAIVLPIIWTETELFWSIVSASLPCLKTFMRPFDKVDEETWRSGQGYSSSRSGVSWGTRQASDRRSSIPLEEIKLRQDSTVGSPGIMPRSLLISEEAFHSSSQGSGGADGGRRSWASEDKIVPASRP